MTDKKKINQVVTASSKTSRSPEALADYLLGLSGNQEISDGDLSAYLENYIVTEILGPTISDTQKVITILERDK